MKKLVFVLQYVYWIELVVILYSSLNNAIIVTLNTYSLNTYSLNTYSSKYLAIQ